MRGRPFTVLAAILASSLSAATPATAEEAAVPDPGRILFVRGGVLIAIAGDGKGAETEVARVPETIGAPRWMEASPDGSVIVVQGEKGSAWLVAGESTLRTGCDGRARPSPTAECVLCETADALTIIGTKKSFTVKVGGAWRDVDFLGGPRELATLTADGVVAFAPKKPQSLRTLAAAGATSHLRVAPNGSMAVAVFGHGKESRVHVFVLDGKGVPRSLGGPGTPLAWSADSTWVLIEEGHAPDEPTLPGEGGGEGEGEGEGEGDEGGGEGADEEEGSLDAAPDGAEVRLAAAGAAPPVLAQKSKASPKKKAKPKKKSPPKEEPPPKLRACVARALGGQSKCWNAFSPRAVSPAGDLVLLYKDGALWAGRIEGVRPEAPKKLIPKADGPALWLSGTGS